MELKELQTIELNILKYVDSFCKKYNIEYFLAEGTLIGAVRHNGFIPWDDDVDLFMKRPDYMRFIECWEKDKDERYKVLSIHNNETYFHPFIKVVDSEYKCLEKNGKTKSQEDMGVWIDIFPLDNYDPKLNSFKKLKWITRKYGYSTENGIVYDVHCQKYPWLKPIKRIIHFIWRNPRKYAFQMNKFLQRCKKPTGKYFAGTTIVGEKGVFDAEWYSKALSLPFEDGSFSCPVGYDKVLTQEYGDYMQMPPEEKRVIRHEILIVKK